MNIYSNDIIQQNAQLKQSIFELAQQTFQLDLQAWDQLGYWDTSYKVHCVERKEEIISNVSTSDATLLLDGNTFRAKQIGTVMTAAPYRRLGYAKTLMNHVLTENENVDYLFLFANKNAASFYEQFGFELVEQRKYSIATNQIQFKQTEIKKLNFNDAKTRTLLLDMLTHRLPVSSKLGVLQNEMIVLFHVVGGWKEHLYYLPALQTIVIGRQEGPIFVLVDFISKHPLLLKELLPYLKVTGDTIQLGFTPSSFHEMNSEPVKDDYFYVKTQCEMPFPSNYYFPDIAKA